MHIFIYFSDWIAVNVLRNVALSTSSVAASVEPAMQQQFFTLSPMAGQENFNSLDVRPQQMMTPTTSSMLAALQGDSFPSGPLDPTSSTFGTDTYGPLSYMDASTTQDDSGNPSGLSFTDFTNPTNSYDVPNFTSRDMGLGASSTPASEPEHDSDLPIKTEQTPGV